MTRDHVFSRFFVAVMQFQCEKKTDVMEVEQVCDLFLSRDDVPLTTFVFLCLLIRPFDLR